MKNIAYLIFLAHLMLLNPAQAQLGQFLGGAGVVGNAMRESEAAERRSQLQQLELEQANRRAEIQRLEHQIRLRQLQQGHLPQTSTLPKSETTWVIATHLSDEPTGDASISRCLYKTVTGFRFTANFRGLCPWILESNPETNQFRVPQ